LQAQKFVTIDLDCSNLSTAKEIEDKVINSINNKSVDNSILRIRLNLSENVTLNEKQFLECAYNNNVYYMLKVQKKLPNVKVILEDSISNTLSVSEALNKYYKEQKRSKERIDKALEIVKEVENCT